MIDYLMPMGLILAASATFSGAEAALFTLGTQGRRRLPVWARPLLDQSVASLTIILFGNLLLNLSYFALATAWARELKGADAVWVEGSAILIIIVGGEILPKVLAHRYPDVLGSILLPPIVLLHHVFQRPAGWVGDHWARPAMRAKPLASSEVSGMLESAELDILDAEAHGLLQQVLELGSLRAGAIRRPLRKVVQIQSSETLRAATLELKRQQVAWAAVLDGQGEVCGILDLSRSPRGRLVGDAMQSVPILPELAPVAAGVPLLRARGSPFVLLVDEYGHGTGIIERGRWADTLLDRLPQSQGKGEGLGPAILEIDAGRYVVDANLPLHDFRDRFGDPGEADPRTETLLGFAEERLGRVLTAGDAFGFVGPGGRYDLKVLRCEAGRPVRFELCWHDENPAEEGA
jgi:CBS domain containing-hemolysin-like protein